MDIAEADGADRAVQHPGSHPASTRLRAGLADGRRLSIDRPADPHLCSGGWASGDIEIGLHGSYNSYANAEQMVSRWRTCDTPSTIWASDPDHLPARQHYLRWAAPETWRHLEQAGALFDSTLGYAEASGFRCGTCRPFPVFDLETEDGTIALGASLDRDGCRATAGLAATRTDRRCPATGRRRRIDVQGMGGEFVVLWHNNNAVGRRGETLYRDSCGSRAGASLIGHASDLGASRLRYADLSPGVSRAHGGRLRRRASRPQDPRSTLPRSAATTLETRRVVVPPRRAGRALVGAWRMARACRASGADLITSMTPSSC